jgi:hypothetical protein
MKVRSYDLEEGQKKKIVFMFFAQPTKRRGRRTHAI